MSHAVPISERGAAQDLDRGHMARPTAGWLNGLAAVAAGAVLLAWPAFANGYPLVFSDTAALGAMGLEPNMGWDKPWVYGPLILLLHWGISLWGVVAGQALAVSAVLWQVGRAVGRGGAWRHLGLCLVLACASAAPWFVAFVMPDIFAPLAVLCLFLLAWGRLGRIATGCVMLLAAIAIASHLAHLIVAAGCLLAVAATRARRLLACAAPLALALAWLTATNLVGNGVAGVSPYGSVFALARLQADGPGADYIHDVCPAAALRLCAWSDRLPMDSDAFLWAADGPLWAHDFGPIPFTPEASRLVASIIRYEPLEVAENAALNTLRQLVRTRVGDTLGPEYLDATVGLLLRTYFPPADLRRFEAGRQVHDTLQAVAAPLAPVRLAMLVAGAAGTVLVVGMAWRRRPALAALALTVLLGVLANAFATGALSGPHDRYAARIAWLLLVAPCLALANARASSRVAA